MIRTFLNGATLALLMGAGLALTPVQTQAADMGICNFTQQNMFAGPYKVCQNNIDEATCLGRAEEDENSDASFAAEASCASEAAVGACTTSERATTYYEGDPSGLAIGCGFQQGEWADAE